MRHIYDMVGVLTIDWYKSGLKYIFLQLTIIYSMIPKMQHTVSTN